MIPIETVNETIVGFIIRGVLSKGYVTISRVFENRDAPNSSLSSVIFNLSE